MEQFMQSSCPIHLGGVRTQLQIHVPALIVLICAITYSWGMDNAQGFAEDVAVNEVKHVEGSTNEGQVKDEVMKILDSDTKSSSPDEVPCWKTESFITQGPCQACDEYSMRYASYCCSETGFRQLVHCETSNSPAYKSCPKTTWAIEHSFWTFEGIMLAVGISSFIVVMFRRRALDWEALQRVRKQIANSV